MDIPILAKLIFADFFKYRSDVPNSTSLPDHWNVVSGSFTTYSEHILSVDSPGEMEYSGDSILLYNHSVNANFAFYIGFEGQEDFICEIRARRNASGSNYTALKINFADGTISIYGVNSNSTLSEISTDFEWSTSEKYCVGLLLYDDRAIAVVNGYVIIKLSWNYNLTNDGFSLYVPSLLTDGESVQFKMFEVVELEDQPLPQLETDASDLRVVYRKQIKALLEDPYMADWESFVNARKIWNNGINLFMSHRSWMDNGYPIQQPTSYQWFTIAQPIDLE